MLTQAPTSPSESDSEDEAALWTARLRSGAIDTRLQRDLEKWLAAAPEHPALLREFCDASADVDAALTVALAERRIAGPAAAPRVARPHFRWVAVAATGIAAALALLLWPRWGHPISTSPGERQSYELADGSQVVLSGNTSIFVSFSPKQRQVEVLGGEALFNVAPDASRPFSVNTHHGLVRVLGTTFNVRADAPEGEEITVLDGKVRVSGADQAASVAMTAGEQAMVYGEAPRVRTLSAEELARVTAWRNGRVIFAAEPLRSALERVAWYHGRRIDVSSQLDGLALGGRYDLEDFDALLDGIARVLPVSILKAPDGSVRVVPR